MKLLSYQKDWITDPSRFKILVKSRRIGGTFSTSYEIARKLLSKKNHDITVVTRDQNLGKDFVKDVTKFIKRFNFMNPAQAIPDKYFKKEEIEIPHNSGTSSSRLIAVSSNPNAAIGRGGSIYIDEYACHKDQELLMRLTKPIIMGGAGTMSILSTHRSKNTEFNRLCVNATKPGSEWSLHKTTIVDAINAGFVEQVVNPKILSDGGKPWASREEYLEWLKDIYDEWTFLQELMCEPADDYSSLFSHEEIVIAQNIYNTEGALGQGVNYMGWDISESDSNRGDYATFAIVRASGLKRELLEYIYHPKGTSLDNQLDMAVKVANQYNCPKIVVDASGMGRYPAHVLGKKLGKRVVPFIFTMQSKAEICANIKRSFESRNFRMPTNTFLENDFESIDRIITPSKNITFQSNSIDGHGDMYWAAAMANSVIPEYQNMDIIGVRANRPESLEKPQRIDTISDRMKRNKKMDKKRRQQRYL